MALIRYLLYFLGIGLVSWLLASLEIWSPGSLRLHLQVDMGSGDSLGTSEYSPIEIIQPGILVDLRAPVICLGCAHSLSVAAADCVFVRRTGA